MENSKIPVTILTGFLGSGKTTLLNRILSEQHGQRIAIIENEFGEVGVDQALVINADEEIFEMNNGCICCTVRGDLIRVLGNLMKRRDKFDRVMVETTGLADPGPVAQTFFMDEDIQENFRLDGIVTLVDAKHLEMHLEDSKEAREQVAFADLLVLNKIDLVPESDVDALERRIRSMNAMARILRSHKANVPLAKVLDILEPKPGRYAIFTQHTAEELGLRLEEGAGQELTPTFARTFVAGHTHDDTVTSVGIELPGEVDQDKFNRWLGKLLREQGADIFRSKGILNIRGDDNRFVFQGVHMLLDGTSDRPWGKKSDRVNQLCFIGRKLDRAALNAGFRSCLA
jgi:G3E family GTPase